MLRVKASPAKQGKFKRPVFRIDRRQGVFFILDLGFGIADLKKVVSFILLTVVAVGCQRPAVDVADPTRETRVVTDDLGRTVVVPVHIERVVSTAPSITEMVFATGGGTRLVGVTTFCDYPEEAKSIAKVGDTMTPNVETIVAMKPDVVCVSTASQLETFTKTLEHNGIAVYVSNPTSLDGVFSSMLRFADLFGTGDETSNLVVSLSGIESFIRHTLLLPRDGDPVKVVPVFVQISREPLFTIGKESFFNQVIESAGGLSVTKNIGTAYPKLSKETALALQPEAIILSDSPDNQEPNEAFKNSPAVKNGRVYKINADIISRPGPRLVDALEHIARMLHPEKFRNN